MTRAVAVDLGSRRIGIAVSDGAGTMAFPRPHLERATPADHPVDHRSIAAVVEEVGAEVVVVGLPLSLDGSDGPAASAARDEASALAAALPAAVRVELFDERLTTVSAASGLRAAGKRGGDQRRAVDSAAATVLLQAWLAAR